MAKLISQECFEIWDQFIERWPIEKLRAITLEEYNTLGSKDGFCYCGKKVEDLGSIWDSSAFKFGVFGFDPNAKTQRMKVQVS